MIVGMDFGTTNSSVAYIYGDPRHLQAQHVPVEPVRITMDAENNLTAERMPTLISTRLSSRTLRMISKGSSLRQPRSGLSGATGARLGRE